MDKQQALKELSDSNKKGWYSYKGTVGELNKKVPINSRLSIVSLFNNGLYHRSLCPLKVKCACICGTIFIAQKQSVLSGKTKSCGCYSLELRKTPKYIPRIKELQGRYHAMIRRCYDPKNAQYHNYGGRGVTVCDEWKNDYQKFLDWSINNGYKKELQLDKDTKGNGLLYSPDTCCFIKPIKNANNTSRSLKFWYNGRKKSLSEISRLSGIPYKRLYFNAKIKGYTIRQSILNCEAFTPDSK